MVFSGQLPCGSVCGLKVSEEAVICTLYSAQVVLWFCVWIRNVLRRIAGLSNSGGGLGMGGKASSMLGPFTDTINCYISQ